MLDVEAIITSLQFKSLGPDELNHLSWLTKLRVKDKQNVAILEQLEEQYRILEDHEKQCRMKWKDKKQKAIDKAMKLELAKANAKMEKERAQHLGEEVSTRMARAAHKRGSVAGSVKGEASSSKTPKRA